MDTSSRFKILLRDLPDEGASHEWHLDDAFFEALDQQVIEHGDLDATLRVKQASGAFDLAFRVKGNIQIPCDRCLELMTQPIDTEATLKACLGDHFEDDGDLITIPSDEGEFDVSWNLYEVIALAIPIHHVHPDGQCPEEVEGMLVGDDAAINEPSTESPFAALRSMLDAQENANRKSQKSK